MKLERTPYSVQLDKRRQRFARQNDTPEQTRCLAGAMKWIVALKEALRNRLIGNPMELLPIAASAEGFNAQRFGNLTERRYSLSVDCD
jgi:hypothetical protein